MLLRQERDLPVLGTDDSRTYRLGWAWQAYIIMANLIPYITATLPSRPSMTSASTRCCLYACRTSRFKQDRNVSSSGWRETAAP